MGNTRKLTPRHSLGALLSLAVVGLALSAWMTIASQRLAAFAQIQRDGEKNGQSYRLAEPAFYTGESSKNHAPKRDVGVRQASLPCADDRVVPGHQNPLNRVLLSC